MGFISALFNINPNSMIFKVVATVLASLVLAFGIRVIYSGVESIGYERAKSEFVAKSLKDMELARSKEQSLQIKINEANDERTKQEQALFIVVATNRERTNQLRQQLDSANRNLSKYSSAALIERVNTVSDIFEQCTVAYTDMAEKADRHAADVQLIVNAWPKP